MHTKKIAIFFITILTALILNTAFAHRGGYYNGYGVWVPYYVNYGYPGYYYGGYGGYPGYYRGYHRGWYRGHHRGLYR